MRSFSKILRFSFSHVKNFVKVVTTLGGVVLIKVASGDQFIWRGFKDSGPRTNLRWRGFKNSEKFANLT